MMTVYCATGQGTHLWASLIQIYLCIFLKRQRVDSGLVKSEYVYPERPETLVFFYVTRKRGNSILFQKAQSPEVSQSLLIFYYA